MNRRGHLAVLAAAVVLPTTLSVVSTPALAGVAPAAAADGRCTITGTSRADRLVGTPGRDVICGLGGDDVILGRGGDDVLRGGAGSDALVGAGGSDVLAAGGGADRLSGGSGADQLAGGLGGDVIAGGDGRDTLRGGGGNDDLTGGPNRDELDGGSGTNWCTVDAVDVRNRCVYDTAAPTADQVTVSTGRVDVTASDREVRVRVHVTDDTGVSSVRVDAAVDPESFPRTWPTLVSGDVRDGWWEGTLTFKRWSPPATFQVRVTTLDRIGRRASVELDTPSITVVDRNPDLEQPAAKLISPDPTDTYDARRQPVTVPVRARITDAISGVSRAMVCLHEPLDDGAEVYFVCVSMRLRSGDRHDGVWAGEVPIDKGATGGSWNVEISVTDRAHDGTDARLDWLGPDLYASKFEPDPARERPLPNGRGRFQVVGPERSDFTPPSVSSVTVNPAEVDTLPGPASVRFTVRASDAPGGGVGGVYIQLLPASNSYSGPEDLDTSLNLVAGDNLDGTWAGSLQLPQGTPPGRFYLKVVTWDRTHWHTYASSGSPEAGGVYDALAGNPTVTIVDSSGG